MKRRSLFVLATFLAPGLLPASAGHGSAAPPDPPLTRWAVIVGISEYADPEIEPLEYADDDTEVDALEETGFPLQHVFHALSQACSYQTIFLSDASHSRWVSGDDRRGLLPNPVNRQLLVGGAFLDTRYLALTAAEPGLTSVENRRFGGGHSVFTHYLLEGVRGAADADGDGLVRLGELINFPRDRVRRATDSAQLPTASHSLYDPEWVMAGGR